MKKTNHQFNSIRGKMHNTIESNLNAEGLKFAVIVPRFNDFITSRLLDGAMDCLKRHGANLNDTQVSGSGAFEIPMIAKNL